MPRVCIWELTRACNLTCVHCSNHGKHPSPRELDFSQQLRIAEELAALGCRTVDVTGGEPLLAPQWAGLCRRLSDLGLQVAVVSNGTLLDERTLAQAVTAGVHTVSVSVDGLQATHDATRRYVDRQGSPFEAALSGIQRAREALRVAAITQVNRYNLAELPALGHLLGELGVAAWQLQLAIPTEHLLARPEPYAIAPADLETLVAFIVAAREDPRIPPIHTSDTIGYVTPEEVLLRSKGSSAAFWMGCVAGIRAVAIKYDGTVRGCSLMPRDFDAGDLHDEPLSTIWNDRRRFAYSACFDRSHLSGGCARCRFGALCRAGCTTLAYFASGTTGENPYCLRRVREERA